MRFFENVLLSLKFGNGIYLQRRVNVLLIRKVFDFMGMFDHHFSLKMMKIVSTL
jgi:hypothetical protein